jgi:hypothetical protein
VVKEIVDEEAKNGWHLEERTISPQKNTF